MSCVAIDCRFASAHAGLGTYTRSIAPPLIRHLKGHHVVLFVRSVTEEWLSSVDDSVTLCTVDAPHYSVKEQLEIPRRLKQLSVDVFYCPHFNVPLRCPTPFVTTVHDLILHTYPNNASFLKRIAYHIVMKHAVRKAAHVIAVSDFTKQEVQNTYGIDATHVTEGVDPMFTNLSKADTEAVTTEYELLGDYFLYVGGSSEHKNIQTLIDGHAASGTSTPLIIVSNGKGLSSLSLQDNVSILTNVPHRDLPALYNGATCFVTASLYEGFCLPVLEARACGTPVIASNKTAIPEIAGTHALLVEPTAEGIATALQHPPSRADKVEAIYNWNAAAKEVSAILRSVHG